MKANSHLDAGDILSFVTLLRLKIPPKVGMTKQMTRFL